MNLTVDLGNSAHKMHVFDDDQLIERAEVKKISVADLEKLFSRFPIRAAILSSVDKAPEKALEFLASHTSIIELSHLTPLPIENAYKTPETLGKDRLACAVGAAHIYPQSNVLVIDAGTCIKYDMVKATGEYIGGAISPGLRMRLEAMHNFTARLPLIQPVQPESLSRLPYTGNDTRTSMLSGALHGALFEAEGMIAYYEQHYHNLTVVACGGDAPFFDLHVKRQIFARPNLVAEGLNTILNFNQKQL